MRNFLKPIVALMTLLVFPYLVMADWKSPAKLPTEGNTFEPINVGDTLQKKSGTLYVGKNLKVSGITKLLGNVGIGGYFGDLGGNHTPREALDVDGTIRADKFCFSIRDINGLITTGACIDPSNNGQGPQGPAGINSIVKVSDEPAGIHCTAGGKKVESGLDTNKNGILDAIEVNSVNYACNGLNGTNGVNGTDGRDGVPGQCLPGGSNTPGLKTLTAGDGINFLVNGSPSSTITDTGTISAVGKRIDCGTDGYGNKMAITSINSDGSYNCASLPLAGNVTNNGKITSITSYDGSITIGGYGGTKDLSVSRDKFQARVVDNCMDKGGIASINRDGGVVCAGPASGIPAPCSINLSARTITCGSGSSRQTITVP